MTIMLRDDNYATSKLEKGRYIFDPLPTSTLHLSTLFSFVYKTVFIKNLFDILIAKSNSGSLVLR